MPASPADSAIYRDLFGDAEVSRLFSDSAEVRAMLLVEGALARAQGAAGMIPETASRAIERAAREVEIDPATLAPGAAASAVPVPALVEAFRAAMGAPDHAAFVHWGATSQDIVDTALVLRLRQVLLLYEARLVQIVHRLADLAEAHVQTPMTGRTYGQAAVPIAFGAVAAGWGAPLLRHLDRLAELRPRLLRVSLSGAAGTLSAMGPAAAEVRAGLARELGLADPGESWHAQRDSIVELAGWLAGVAGSLGKIGGDLVLLAQTGIGEVRLGASGGSSTMPQKANPVLPSLLVALARQVAALASAVHGAAIHTAQRDGTAWMVEWLSLPQMCLLSGRALTAAAQTLEGLHVDAETMQRHIEADGGLVHAEALTFELARHMPRPEAQRAVASLCTRARESGSPLRTIAAETFPEAEVESVFDLLASLGAAPEEARAFARTARSRRAMST